MPFGGSQVLDGPFFQPDPDTPAPRKAPQCCSAVRLQPRVDQPSLCRPVQRFDPEYVVAIWYPLPAPPKARRLAASLRGIALLAGSSPTLFQPLLCPPSLA